MHVCKATIQDYDFFFTNPELFLIFESIFSEKWQAVLSKTLDFRCSTYI
jgi:hypothetical protein